MSNLFKYLPQKHLLFLILISSLFSFNCNAKISTHDILQMPPFNINLVAEREKFISIAKDLDINLDKFLHGEVYSKQPYDNIQQQEIVQELIVLFNKNFTGKLPDNKLYIATAGAPGIGKSVFLENYLAKDANKYKNFIYIDPDRQVLRFMYSYWKLANLTGDEAAYETYRDASNFISNFQLVWAIYKGYNIAHGTTSTNDRVAKRLLPGLKNFGYTIEMHVLFASQESRNASLLHRLKVQEFYQVTPADAKSKVEPVYLRLIDAYLKYADKIIMYYNSDNFWLNTSQTEPENNLMPFIMLDKKINESIITFSNTANILSNLISEATIEITDKNKRIEAIELFKLWADKKAT